MVLGNSFQCTANHPALLVQGEEDRQKDATWRNLLTFLATLGIDPGGCFFTNAHIGLVEGAEATRIVPAMSDPGYVGRCRTFFLHQIAILRPRLILALGTKVPPFLAPLSPQTAIWNKTKTWAEIDAEEGGLVEAAMFPGFSGAVTIVCLLHPSYRGPNLRRRTFAGLTGAAAEEALVRKGLRCSESHSHVPQSVDITSTLIRSRNPSVISKEFQ